MSEQTIADVVEDYARRAITRSHEGRVATTLIVRALENDDHWYRYSDVLETLKELANNGRLRSSRMDDSDSGYGRIYWMLPGESDMLTQHTVTLGVYEYERMAAAARRAERYETALRGMYDEARSAAKDLDASPDLHEWAAYLRDHIHALLWGSSPPEPPQSRPSGAHSPEAGGGV